MYKSIHYFSLATNQNHAKTQFNLGYLNEKGKLITRDMNKSIHYYSLAANQNDTDAQINLGLLYSEGKLITRGMNKSIHYFSLAENQNDVCNMFNIDGSKLCQRLSEGHEVVEFKKKQNQQLLFKFKQTKRINFMVVDGHVFLAIGQSNIKSWNQSLNFFHVKNILNSKRSC